tara:strand:+ start:244 stop:456 length:213 start_codon:yes stop_codon:yes gene_type:complete
VVEILIKYRVIITGRFQSIRRLISATWCAGSTRGRGITFHMRRSGDYGAYGSIFFELKNLEEYEKNQNLI